MQLQLLETPRKIIVDVDAGTDDAWALFMLLRAAEEGLIDIRAITCVHGNTDLENVTQNVLRVLHTVGKEKDLLVFKGCPDPLITHEGVSNNFYHGFNGFGDTQFEDTMDLSLLQQKHAVNAIADIVRENPNDIELIFLGPLTNLAVAIRMYGKEFVENIKALWIMGGNILGAGNITGAAEFNFYGDPEAAQIVLDALKCPVTIVPWETCTDRFLRIPLTWRLQQLGAIDNKITQLLNLLDDFFYVRREREFFKPCDALLTAVFLSAEAAEVTTKWHACVELHGRYTRGQMVLDHLRKNPSNTVVVEKVSEEAFKALLMWTVGHAGHVTVTDGRRIDKMTN